MTIASIVGTIVFYAVILGPLIGRMDKNIKDTRQLLLLYPDHTSSHIHGLSIVRKDMIQDK